MGYPKKYKKICELFVQEYFAARRRQIENNFSVQAFFPAGAQRMAFLKPLETPLGLQVVEIARAAAGELPDDKLARGLVAEGIQGLLEDLFAPPGLAYAYTIPAAFWSETPFGRMVRDAHLWVRRDALITQMAAAEMVGVGVRTVGQRMDKSLLTVYVDESEPNPQRNRRVSRLEVEAWMAKRGGAG